MVHRRLAYNWLLKSNALTAALYPLQLLERLKPRGMPPGSIPTRRPVHLTQRRHRPHGYPQVWLMAPSNRTEHG